MTPTAFARDSTAMLPLEGAMKRRVPTLSLVALLAGAAATAATSTEPAGLFVPAGGLVVDGGDAEAAGAADGSCLDPALADDGAPRPSLAAGALGAAAADPQPASARRPL